MEMRRRFLYTLVSEVGTVKKAKYSASPVLRVTDPCSALIGRYSSNPSSSHFRKALFWALLSPSRPSSVAPTSPNHLNSNHRVQLIALNPFLPFTCRDKKLFLSPLSRVILAIPFPNPYSGLSSQNIWDIMKRMTKR